MPELPDVELYLSALRGKFQGQTIKKIMVKSPFVLRSFEFDIDECVSRTVLQFSRIGKRIVWHLSDDFFLVFHLMISGRFHLRKPQLIPRSKTDLVAFWFPDVTLMLTEASPKKRASLHVVRGAPALQPFHRGGIDVLQCSFDEFATRLQQKNRTVKRALTDPDAFDGIGNAYSDEILHDARLSPFARTQRLNADDCTRLFHSVQTVLRMWINRLREQSAGRFPEKVTAFRPEMAVHGKYREPCPRCGSKVQRIRYSENEWNYCPTCQTDGKLLADRSLSRLMHDEWPKSAEELD